LSAATHDNQEASERPPSTRTGARFFERFLPFRSLLRVKTWFKPALRQMAVFA
jgi:hypothetical protein